MGARVTRCPICHDTTGLVLPYSYQDHTVMCARCGGRRRNEDRARAMIAGDLGIEDPDCEWWVLIDPKNDTWKRVTETKAKKYAVVECRMKHAITYSQMEQLYDC